MAKVQSPDRDFTNIPLDGDAAILAKKKAPKRVLHFSDGTLEEYSSDEENDQVQHQNNSATDPYKVKVHSLQWIPWIWYYLALTFTKTFNAADSCGEKLAWFFGITSPKYQSAIDEYYRAKRLEDKEKAEDNSLQSVQTGEMAAVTTAPQANEPLPYVVSEPVPKQDYQNLDKY